MTNIEITLAIARTIEADKQLAKARRAYEAALYDYNAAQSFVIEAYDTLDKLREYYRIK